MANLFLGVDIGSKYTKVVVLEQKVKICLLDAFLFPTPLLKGGKDDDKQVDPEIFLKQIDSFFPLAKLRRAKIAINLPPMSITAFLVFLPLLPRKELFYIAVNEAKQKMIPVAGPNHIFDCLFLGEAMVKKVPRSEVLVIRTEKVYIQRTLDIFQGLDLYPILISPSCTILPNLVPMEAWKKEEAVAIVDIGAAYLKIAICSDAKMVFTRNIVFGMDEIIQDFVRQLGLTVEEVEALIKEYGIPNISFDSQNKAALAEEVRRQKYEVGLKSLSGAKVGVNLLELRSLWQPHIEKIAQELRRSFVFYHEHSEEKRIEKIFFTGGGSHLKNFQLILSSLVGGKCEVILPFTQTQQELPVANKFKDEVISSAIFASAASLAFAISLRLKAKETRINFLPEEFKQKENVVARRVILLIIMACFISFFVLGALQLFIRNQLVQKDIRVTEQKLSQVKRVSEQLKRLDENQSKIKQRDQEIEKLIQLRTDFVPFLNDLVEIMPEEIVLSKCVVTGKKIEIEGNVSADYEEAKMIIDSFKKDLSKNKKFNNVVISSLELEEIFPELDSGAGVAEELRLTECKERKFKLSMDIVGGKIAVRESKSARGDEISRVEDREVLGENKPAALTEE